MLEVSVLKRDKNSGSKQKGVREIFFVGRKGIYEIITTFILITIIVFAVIGFVALYGLIFKTQGGSTQKSDELMTAKSFYSELLSQHSKTMLLGSKLDALNSCIEYLGVSAYSIRQDARFGCSQKEWSCKVPPEDVARSVYWVIVQQNDTTTCLAKLYIYSK
jgi:hypothetical protein